MVKASAIKKAIALRDELADEALALDGPNADAERHAVMALVKQIDHIEDAQQTREALNR